MFQPLCSKYTTLYNMRIKWRELKSDELSINALSVRKLAAKGVLALRR